MRGAAAPGEPDAPVIGVLLRFDAAPAEGFVREMEGELARIMGAADLRLKWLTPEQSDGKQSYARAVIFTFHGDCRAVPDAREARAEMRQVTLADTAVEGDAILPFSDMNCDRLRAFLSGEEPETAGMASRMGVAMGRVLAHEMYHVLLQTRTHGSHGISRAVHTPSALLSKELRFDDAEIVRFRERFHRPAAVAHADVAQGADGTPVTAQNISFRPN